MADSGLPSEQLGSLIEKDAHTIMSITSPKGLIVNMSILAFTGSFASHHTKSPKTAQFVGTTKVARSNISNHKSNKLDLHDADCLPESITTLQSLPTYLKTAYTPEVILSIVRF